MKNSAFIRISAALALCAAFSGCASLSKSECLNANWEDIGIRDGANGQPEEYLIQHSTACAKVGVTPDRERWLAGRERGLERFCTPQRAYQIGEYGGGFDAAICRNFDPERLRDAYDKGRDVNRLTAEIGALDNEIRDIHIILEQKDLEPKERERLAFRLGQLVYQRNDAQRAYDDARYRARNL
jgi:hypothetical protein